MSRSTEVSGTVAKFEWSNPHVFLWVYVAKADGGFELYAFEGGSPGTLLRSGWSADTIKAGEKIAVDFHPLRDGRSGGSFFKVIHADGSQSLNDAVTASGDRQTGPR